jgi:hypothetical protein
MSTKGGTDEATRLAREEEKAAVARAKAELEAEREAMRAELAAIEEEERIEADRVKKAAIAGLNSSSGSSSLPLLPKLTTIAKLSAICMN